MGSGTSKDPSPAASGPRRPRPRAFGASCFGLSSSPPRDPDYDDDGEGKAGRTDGVEIKSSREISEGSRRRRKTPPSSANAGRDGAHQESSGSSDADPAISSNPSSRSRSRFGFIPDGIGSRLGRAMSLGSSRARSLFPETTCDDVGSENEEDVAVGAAAGDDAAADHSSRRNHVESASNEIRRYNHSQLEGSVRFKVVGGDCCRMMLAALLRTATVRALQRLGSRFESLSGHERSCISSGQHRTGRCTCRATARVASNPSDEPGTRASLSRIVMLAEALFEVLDEIHQQSVALSSRPAFSSIGSVPAPKEVVECMPVKVYMKPQKHQHDEIAQCYICLVEYEDGDFMRILPCNHEFHQKCIDKWLKEIHRVCPLCRGDVCRTEVSGADKIS
ncbi:uncharacterized protein A4U43_C10F400 [Asparagus officinalis]|uniref:RING-type domain-containing protein n=1 Tax=Asparagus officinalis TaxID=4686 RepID=A0A5P1E011_ASPOF|nr:uncharacterized protein A4U43_C10F400 [Asparagus officinalis]